MVSIGKLNLPSVAWAGGDVTVIGIIIAAIVGYLPAIAAGIAIVWYAIQIYESATTQNLLKDRRLQRLVKLRAEATALELLLRTKNTGLTALNEANKIHAAAVAAAAAAAEDGGALNKH